MGRRSTGSSVGRRRFVTLAGATGVVSVAGCIGGEDESSDQGEGETIDGGNENDENGEDGETPEEGRDEFDFPPGANENGLVTATVLSGFSEFVGQAERYRIEHQRELSYSDAPRDRIDVTYDVDGRAVYEQLKRNDTEFDRWITPERTVARSANDEADRHGQWRSETVGRTKGSDDMFEYPLTKTTVPALIGSTSFDFAEIVTEGERSYARYTGELGDSDRFRLRKRRSARIEYRPESVSGGHVSLLLAESGAVRALDYEFTVESTRVTHEGREPVELSADGQVRFEYDDLEDRTTPEWVESAESDDIRSFGLEEASLGLAYRQASGPSLPGTLELEYSDFYVMAEFDGERYFAKYSTRREFDDTPGFLAYLVEGELKVDWQSMSGRDAFEEADRVEISTYLRAPGEGRTMVFHEERRP